MSKNHIFIFLLGFLLIFGCTKSSNNVSNNYFIKFNVGATTYLIHDTLNVIWAQKFAPFATRYVSGNAIQVFQLYADVESGSTKDSAENGFYTLTTMDILGGFNLNKDSSVLGTYINSASTSINKKTGAGGTMQIYSKNDINKGQWFTDVNGILPFTITVTEVKNTYISGTFEGQVSKAEYYTAGDSSINISEGSFKVPYQ